MNRCAAFKKVSHVIFDLDGVLLDTEKLYTLAVQNVVKEYGKVFDWPVKFHIMGLTGALAAVKVVELLDLPLSPEEFYRLAKIQYAIVMKDAQVIPGTLPLICFHVSDTEVIYKNTIANIAKRFGKKYTPEIQGKVIGTVERESSRIAVTEMELPMSIDSFQIEFRTNAHKHFHTVPLMPGAEKVVRHLHKHKIPIAVATSSTQDSFNLKTAKHKELFSLFSHIVCGGSDPEVKEGKPKPDIFLACASRFADKPCPVKCLVLEDAPNGVTAAIAAGMQVVMVPDENVPPELRKHAHLVVNCIEETPLDLFGLPPLKS